MGDLAEALVITRGGLTKLVDRLIKAGLLERTFCETDRRVSYATLMPAGRDLLDEMRPVVVAELDVAFAAKLSAAEADALRETLERVASACGLRHPVGGASDSASTLRRQQTRSTEVGPRGRSGERRGARSLAASIRASSSVSRSPGSARPGRGRR